MRHSVERTSDQAAGLRRLFGALTEPDFAIVGAPRVGKTTLALNLTAALAESGRPLKLAECRDRAESARLAYDAVCWLLVVAPQPHAVVSGYALLKDFARNAHEVALVVMRAESELEARTIHARIERTARRFLGIAPAWLGWVPEDGCVARALALGTSAVEAFPGCRAAAHFRALADRVTRRNARKG